MPSTASAPIVDHPSVFDVLNLFRACWFLNHKHLMSLVLAAVKGGDNNDIMWINLLPSTHTHLLHQAKALAPPSYPLSLLKRVMFTFLLEVVNSCGSVLDKFIKTLAPRRYRAPAPLPLVPWPLHWSWLVYKGNSTAVLTCQLPLWRWTVLPPLL